MGRFLALMENGAPKRLLPVYRDMDRYALPGAFSPLRAWDMNEIDFAQELIRELGAPLPPPAASAVPPADKNAAAGQAAFASEPMEQTAFAPDPVREAGLAPHDFSQPRQPEQKVLLSAEAGSLLRRALLFLEDGDWKSADEYCEKVLDLEPECAEAYVGKLMAELHASRPEQLGDYEWPLDGLDNYRKAVRFADQKLRAQLEESLEQTRAKIPEHYVRARQIMSEVYFNRYRDALRILEKIPDYRDAQKMIEFCKKKIAGENDEDDAGGCFATGCLVALIFLFLFMVVGIVSVFSTIS